MRFSYRDITSYRFDGRLPNEDEVKEFDSVYYLSLVNCVIDSFQFCVDYTDKYEKRCCGLYLYNCEVKDWSALEDMSLFKIGIIETDMPDISVIGSQVGLHDITLARGDITDISTFERIWAPVNVQILWNPSLKDISAFRGKDSLETLDFDFCGVSDLSPLAGLPNLERLRVTRNPVSDFSVLRSNPNLKFLKWKSDDESSTASDTLSELTQLRTLFIGGKAIKNLEFLRGMTSLTKLFLFDCNDSCDCTMLKEIKNLRNLSISDCNVPDTSFLFKMPWLERLRLQRSMFSEEEAQRLAEAYPDGVVSFSEEEPLKN